MENYPEAQVKEMLAELNQHPMVVKLREDNKAKTLKKREAAAESIKKLEEEERELLPGLHEKLEQAQAELKEAETKVQELKTKVNQAKSTESGARFHFEREKSIHRDFLLETCDPSIADDIEFFRKEIDRLRRPGAIQTYRSRRKFDLIGWKQEVDVENNIDAINLAIQYCQASLKQIQEMAFLPVYPEKRVEELIKGIPLIDRYDLIRVEPSNAPKGPLPVAPERSQVQKLLSQADRLLGR